MAKLARLPDFGTIAKLRGVLDFYADRGQFIVRTWPTGKSIGQGPGPATTQPLFARINRLKSHASDRVKVALARYTMGGTHLWHDEMVTAYYGLDRPNDQPLPTYPTR